MTAAIYLERYSDASVGLTSKAGIFTAGHFSRRRSFGFDITKEPAKIMISVADKSLIDTGQEDRV